MNEIIKKLYNFVVPKEETLPITTETTNDKGEKISITKEEKVKVDQKFFIRKPNRGMKESAELYYWVKHAECVRAGCLTRSLIAKRYDNDNGVFSEKDKEYYSDVRMKLLGLNNEFQKLSLKVEEERSDEEKKKYKELLDNILDLQREIQKFEFARENIFNGTAENIANNKTTIWWVVNLSYKEDKDGKSIPLFEGKIPEDKMDRLEEMQEVGDEFLKSVIQKFIFYVLIWTQNTIENTKDFESLINTIEENTVKDKI